MNESKVAEDIGAIGMADAHDWHRHFRTEDVGHVKKIANMVGPCS